MKQHVIFSVIFAVIACMAAGINYHFTRPTIAIQKFKCGSITLAVKVDKHYTNDEEVCAMIKQAMEKEEK